MTEYNYLKYKEISDDAGCCFKNKHVIRYIKMDDLGIKHDLMIEHF